MNRIRKKISFLTGTEGEFPSQMLIFHGANLITIVLLVMIIITNAILGFSRSLPFLFIIAMIHFVIFYISRFKNKFRLAVIGLFIVGYGGFLVTYFSKSGISGPAILIAPFVFLLVFVVTPQRYHKLLISVNIGIVALLFICEYLHADWVLQVYRSKKEHFVDLFTSFTLLLVATYFIISMLIQRYIDQKFKAQKQAVKLTEEHRALEAVTLQKDRLFSLVFHDLKSPLSSIQFYLEQFTLLSENDGDHESIRQHLLMLTKTTSSMLETMLLWVKEQVFSAEPKFSLISIDELINRAVVIEKAYADQKNVKINISSLYIMVRADNTLLQILIRAVINNAIKYSLPGENISISTDVQQEKCIVAIKDNGHGIPYEIQKQIFKGVVIPQPGTNTERGTGVGLNLAKELAIKQDIELRFDSQPGLGTTFYIIIPK